MNVKRVVIRLMPETAVRLGAGGRFVGPDGGEVDLINELLDPGAVVARVYPLFGSVSGDSPEEQELMRFIAVDLSDPSAADELAAELNRLTFVANAYVEEPASPA